MNNFKTIFKEARKKQGLTQEQAAELLDVCPRWIQKIESGEKLPGRDLLLKIIKLFSIDPSSLID